LSSPRTTCLIHAGTSCIGDPEVFFGFALRIRGNDECTTEHHASDTFFPFGAYKAALYLLRRVVNLDLKTVAKEFGISTTRVSKIQGEIEGIDQIDPKSLKLLKQHKVKQ